MSGKNKPKHKTFRVVKLYDVQSTYEVEVPVVYLKKYNYEPMAYSEWEKRYVQPDEVVDEYISKDTHIDDDWEGIETLETEEI